MTEHRKKLNQAQVSAIDKYLDRGNHRPVVRGIGSVLAIHPSNRYLDLAETTSVVADAWASVGEGLFDAARRLGTLRRPDLRVIDVEVRTSKTPRHMLVYLKRSQEVGTSVTAVEQRDRPPGHVSFFHGFEAAPDVAAGPMARLSGDPAFSRPDDQAEGSRGQRS